MRRERDVKTRRQAREAVQLRDPAAVRDVRLQDVDRGPCGATCGTQEAQGVDAAVCSLAQGNRDSCLGVELCDLSRILGEQRLLDEQDLLMFEELHELPGHRRVKPAVEVEGAV